MSVLNSPCLGLILDRCHYFKRECFFFKIIIIIVLKIYFIVCDYFLIQIFNNMFCRKVGSCEKKKKILFENSIVKKRKNCSVFVLVLRYVRPLSKPALVPFLCPIDFFRDANIKRMTDSNQHCGNL